MNKVLTVFIAIAIAVVIFIAIRNPVTPNESCSLDQTRLFIQTGCPHCATQLKILGDNYPDLEIIDCAYNSSVCAKEGIMSIPTWDVKGKRYSGVRTLGELEGLIGC